MKPLFTGEELRRLRRIDEGLEERPLSRGEILEAEARDRAIGREARGAMDATARPGQGLTALPEGWFEQARARRFSTTEEAASAARVSAKLMWHLECGSVTAPELALRIGRALGLSLTEIRAITCARTVTRRREEARALPSEAHAGKLGA